MRHAAITIVLLSVAAAIAGCDKAALSSDARSKAVIRTDHTSLQEQLTAKQGELSGLQASLIEEGWTYNYASELVPPRGMDPGGQTAETQARLRGLKEEIAEIQNRMDWNRRLWRHRHYEVAELTRDAAAETTAPVHPH